MNDHEKDYVIECLQRWGSATSIALLDPRCTIFREPSLDGVIGYRNEAGCAVIFGVPLCAPENMKDLVHSFYYHCNEQKKIVIYVAVPEKFMDWALDNGSSSALQIGDEIILDPHYDPKSGGGRYQRLLRGKYNQSIRHKVIIKEYTDNNPALEKEIEEVGARWLRNRRGPQIYLLDVNIFADRCKGEEACPQAHL